jgi:hypothetical protein
MDSIKMQGSILVKGVSYLFYASVAAFIIFLILIVVHYTVNPIFSFLPSNVIESKSTQNYTNKILFPVSPAPSDTKMTFTPEIAELNKDKFTLTFDCYLNGTYLSTTVPRVLFYFGSTPVSILNNNNLREYISSSEEDPPKLLTLAKTDLITKFQQTNFIVYVDPVKNDMKVGVFTVSSIDPTKKYLEIASIIPNIPIKETFQISIVLNNKFIEVYKNKKLVNTYKIGSLAPEKVVLNTSAVPSTDYGIYTPISYIKDTIKIGNVQFYNGTLTSGQIRDLIKAPKTNTFFTS